MDTLQNDRSWIEGWINAKKEGTDSIAAPVQLYPGKLRAAQGYLTKMPADFVERWEPLRKLADRLSDTQERLTQLAQSAPPTLTPTRGHSKEFRPKSADEYAAMIRGGVQVRSRHHERLVKEVGELLQQAGAVVSTPHPIDLLMTSPHMVIFEAKIVGGRDPALAVREAVGQLLEYRYFLGPRDAELCIVLDEEPPALLISYVEDELRMWIAWC